MIQTALRSQTQTPQPSAAAGAKEIPFDQSFRYELEGKPGRVINSTVTVSIGSSFTAVSIGYGVAPIVQPIVFGPRPFRRGFPIGVTVGPAPAAIARNLGSVTIADIIRALDEQLVATSSPLSVGTVFGAVLRNGIKLNPDVAEFALQSLEAPNPELAPDVIGRLFQVVAAPPDQVQFKYAIFDDGSGREFQSEPILNVAGLGSANGERPFRYFARPITFPPRSTIRMEVTEVSDFTGELHVTLHGYKVLPAPDSGAIRRAARGRRR